MCLSGFWSVMVSINTLEMKPCPNAEYVLTRNVTIMFEVCGLVVYLFFFQEEPRNDVGRVQVHMVDGVRAPNVGPGDRCVLPPPGQLFLVQGLVPGYHETPRRRFWGSHTRTGESLRISNLT